MILIPNPSNYSINIIKRQRHSERAIHATRRETNINHSKRQSRQKQGERRCYDVDPTIIRGVMAVSTPAQAPMEERRGRERVPQGDRRTESEKLLIALLADSSRRIEGEEKDGSAAGALRYALEMIKNLQQAESRRAASDATPGLQPIMDKLTAMEEKIKGIEKQTPAPPSWAQVAGKGLARAPPAVPLRRLREITVRVGDPNEKEEIRGEEISKIRDAIRGKDAAAADSIASIGRLPSGDFVVRTLRPEAKEALENRNEWITAIARSAKTVRRTYEVIAHGVSKTFDISDIRQAGKRIEAENAIIHPGMEIRHIKWLGRPDVVKRYGSVVIAVASAEQANRILDEGIVIGDQDCSTSYYERTAEKLQCYKCFGFGHRAGGCPRGDRCHKCGGEHKGEQCPRTDGAYCANCKSRDHKPWMRRCPEYRKEIERAWNAGRNKPDRYEVWSASDSTAVSSRAASSASSPAAQPTPALPLPAARKRAASTSTTGRVGRPRGASTARNTLVPSSQPEVTTGRMDSFVRSQGARVIPASQTATAGVTLAQRQQPDEL